MLADSDAYQLSRWFAGLDFDDGVPVTPATRLTVSVLDSSNRDDIQIARRIFAPVLEQIFKQDPKVPPYRRNMQVRPEDGVYIPPLPVEAQLTDKALQAAERVAPWWHATTDWLLKRSPMTPPLFLRAGAVWLVSLAIARRTCIDFHDRITPLLYMVWVAETSKYAKSTGLRALQAIINLTMPHMLIPGQTSPEGMIEMLSGQMPTNFDKLTRKDQELVQRGQKFAGQRGILLDEFSSLLGSGKKDYMQGFVELLMRLYDANDLEQHYTRSGGLALIKYPGISILGATTPAAMARNVSHEAWGNGAMARYLLLFRDRPQPYSTGNLVSAPPEHIIHPIQTLHQMLPVIKTNDPLDDEARFDPLVAAATKDAREAYMRYTRAVYYDMIEDDLDERLHGNYRRMHVQALKMALALATLDWSTNGGKGQITIELGHFALGQMMAEESRASLHRMMPVISQSTDSRTHRDLISILRHSPGGLTVRDLVRRTGRNTNEIRSALDVLADAGEVDIVAHQPASGRPTNLYRLL